ncbi:hypothetical protein [Amycolatopsis sp. WAC 04182]|uniref:hypothetical protein n=1 Tax=Amycolatopsis sp. WAC 04182 TaxID=2203198 RepID=UPI001F278C40|nr:hypothetical protein [Amycolatopsis sp. WAC 04182]
MPRPEGGEPPYGGLDAMFVDLPQNRPELGVGALRSEEFAWAMNFWFFGAGRDTGEGS